MAHSKSGASQEKYTPAVVFLVAAWEIFQGLRSPQQQLTQSLLNLLYLNMEEKAFAQAAKQALTGIPPEELVKLE